MGASDLGQQPASRDVQVVSRPRQSSSPAIARSVILALTPRIVGDGRSRPTVQQGLRIVVAAVAELCAEGGA
jgi:hypothetical protein